jgi:hypothetical protein
MKIKIVLGCLLLAVIGRGGIASAGQITLSPVDVGVFSRSYDIYRPQDSLYHYAGLTSLNPSYYGYGGTVQTGYAIYSLGGIYGQTDSASLLFDLTISGELEPTHKMLIFTSSGLLPAAALQSLPAEPITPITQTMYDNLLVFPELGRQTAPTAPGQALYDAPLNSAGLSLLGNGGLLVLSFALDQPTLIYSGTVGFNSAPQLILSGDDLVNVPLTDTLSLLVLACLVAFGVRAKSAV